MKKTLLITSLFIGSLTASFAQPGTPPPPPGPPQKKGEGRGEHRNERKEKIEAMKIGYLTKQLDLTPEEAQKFWPVYNQYTAKERELRKSHKSEFKEASTKLDSMSDKEVETLVDNEIAFRQKEVDLQKEYHRQFKSVLPPRKVARLYRAEEMFKRELVRKIQEGKR